MKRSLQALTIALAGTASVAALLAPPTGASSDNSPPLSVHPSHINLGRVPVGQTASATAVLTLRSQGPHAVNGCTVTGDISVFTVDPIGCGGFIYHDNSFTIPVSFTNTAIAAGTYSIVITVIGDNFDTEIDVKATALSP